MGDGLVEKDLTMFLALRVEERLDKYDCEAEIFQLPNVTALEDMQSVVDHANDNAFDFFLSIHINAAGNPSASGFESFRYPGEDSRYQKEIHTNVTAYLTEFGIQDRGMKEANFLVLRETKMPTVLLECCFLSNPSDARRLKEIRFLDKLANAIAWGLVQALGLKPKQSVKDCAACQELQKVREQYRTARQLLAEISVKSAPYLTA